MKIPWITIVGMVGSFYLILKAESWHGYVIGTSIIIIIILSNVIINLRRPK